MNNKRKKKSSNGVTHARPLKKLIKAERVTDVSYAYVALKPF
jgi:hypothetical protein